MTNGYSPAPAGKTGNLADCVTIKDMSAQEAAAAIASMAAKLPEDTRYRRMGGHNRG